MDETKRKPASVKIISITTKQDTSHIFGLGEDNRIYIWLLEERDWMLSG